LCKLQNIVKKNVSRIRKKIFYLQFCMGTPEAHHKSIFNTSKVKKKNKNTHGIYPTKFAGSTQNHKKIIEPIETKKISNKSMLSTSKVKRSQKFVWGLARRSLQGRPKILKKISEHQIYQSNRKVSQTQTMFSTLKWSRSRKFVWEHNIGTPHLPIKTKVFPKNLCIVP
jgi:hypothetical protein